MSSGELESPESETSLIWLFKCIPWPSCTAQYPLSPSSSDCHRPLQSFPSSSNTRSSSMDSNQPSGPHQDKGKEIEKRPRTDSPPQVENRSRPRREVPVSITEVVAATMGGQRLRDLPPLSQSRVIVDARQGPVAVCRELEKMLIGADLRYSDLSDRCDKFRKERDSLRATNEELKKALSGSTEEVSQLKAELVVRDKALAELEKLLGEVRSVLEATWGAVSSSGCKSPKKEN